MATQRTKTGVAWVLGAATVVWIGMLAGFASGALTDDPPAESPYQSGPGAETTVPEATGEARIIVSAVGFDDGWVEITNTGDVAGSVDGWFLCNRPAYFGLPDVTLGPGESILIASADVTAVSDVATARSAVEVVDASGRIGSITASGGEIGLYRSSSFAEPSQVVAYVEWGSPGHGRSGTAVTAGAWQSGDFVPTDGVVVIESTTPRPTSSSEWGPTG